MSFPTITETALLPLALGALREARPQAKARYSLDACKHLETGGITATGSGTPPDVPARPARPELRRPGDMPRRRKSQNVEGRKALLHALAHIELNAIDLAWDIIARFACGMADSEKMEFARDWARVAADEGRHFLMLEERLNAYGLSYGDLPAHDGLWQTAQATAHDLLARLALVPLLHEARGLDVTPAMITQLRQAGDEESAACIQIIHDEEITHVATGQKWFTRLCMAQNRDPKTEWQNYVQTLFSGKVKPPFNGESRGKAGFPSDWYEPMVQKE